jgi:hypothetical protein
MRYRHQPCGIVNAGGALPSRPSPLRLHSFEWAHRAARSPTGVPPATLNTACSVPRPRVRRTEGSPNSAVACSPRPVSRTRRGVSHVRAFRPPGSYLQVACACGQTGRSSVMKVFLLLIAVFPVVVGCSGDMCSSAPSNFEPCDVDQQTCMGPVACRPCNGPLGLWALIPAWSCGCGTTTLNGKTGLYWQCALPPACTSGPNTFTDSKCTMAAGN